MWDNVNMKTIGSVESFTGGLFASTLVSIPGASKFFKGAIVSYSNGIKQKLGIDTSRGVISKEMALEMAKRGKTFLGVDFCISFTGNAGPDFMEGKPVGLVFVSINDEVYELKLSGTRNEVRQKAVDFALEKIKDMNLI